MNNLLLALTHEARQRLRSETCQGRPELLGCDGELCLLRSPTGLLEKPIEACLLPQGPWNLGSIIDHTLLRPEADAAQIEQLCAEARSYRFASVCVNPVHVRRASEQLEKSGVRVCTVVGFPLGASTTHQKASEAKEALSEGAHEIDMVIALGAVKSGDWTGVRAEFKELRQAVPLGKATLKVILETCLLDDEEKIRACEIARDEGLDFVKTSTGFSSGGATEADVKLMRKTVGPYVGVKASGGIRDYGTALRMVMAGATRLGVSASLHIIQGTLGESPLSY
jgi:deoxyribose-phosphate aldolase